MKLGTIFMIFAVLTTSILSSVFGIGFTIDRSRKENNDEDSTCDPLVPEVCFFPFPNNFYIDPVTRKLNLSGKALPLTRFNQSINPYVGGWNELDGFSHLDLSNLPQLWNVELSMSSSSPTILINANTGERVPHWCELDHSADSDHPEGYERMLIVWPAERLNNSHTYFVAFRNLKDIHGKVIAASPAFAALRDNTSSPYPSVNDRRQRYDSAIFPELAFNGFERSSLQLAWEFTVMTTRTITNRLVSMRDDAFERTKNGISFLIESVTNNPRPGVARELRGVMTVPWYLNQLTPGQSVRVNTAKYDTNIAEYNGDGAAQFLVIVPESLAINGTKGAVMQYGHGLFGSMSELETGYLDDEANRYGYVLVATNWLGMCWEDELPVAAIIAEDLSNFAAVPDRSHQGMLNALLLMRLVTSERFINDKNMMFNGSTVVDPTRKYYYGNSQGGIFGGVYMGISTDVTRGVLGVAGAPYSLLLPRSADFKTLFEIIKLRYTNPTTRISLLACYLHHISRDPLPNTPKHTVIGHYGLGDAQVTWLGMLTIGRSVRASMFESNVREGNETLYGFPFVKDTTTISGIGNNLIQGWNFGAPQAPFINIPPSESSDTHEKPRRTLTAQEQTHYFLEHGIIYNACSGPCHGDDGGYL
eukprot:gene6961-7613_t